MKRPSILAATGLLPFLAGCHTFNPVATSALEPGDAVRITLTRQESANQLERLGAFRESLQGTVRDLEGSALGITLPADLPPPTGSPANAGLRSYLEIPWDGVAGVEVKRIDWVRTGLLAAGAAVAAVVILDVADDSGGGSGGGGGVDQQRVSVPLLTFRR